MTEIHPDGIKSGDHIREEYRQPKRFPELDGISVSAIEYIATGETHTFDRDSAKKHVLLPRPVIDLPEDGEFFFGWLTADRLINGRVAGEWFNDNGKIKGLGFEEGVSVEHITSYVPASMVPTKELDKLRARVYKDVYTESLLYYADKLNDRSDAP